MFLRLTPETPVDLGFAVQDATFELDLLALLEHAYECRDSCAYLKKVPGQFPAADELAAAWGPTIQILEELVAKTEHGEVAETASGDHGLGDCVAPIVAERKYRVVSCPACSKSYQPGEVREEDFGYDEQIVGGQRYLCPENHVLFVFIRFDTRIQTES